MHKHTCIKSASSSDDIFFLRSKRPLLAFVRDSLPTFVDGDGGFFFFDPRLGKRQRRCLGWPAARTLLMFKNEQYFILFFIKLFWEGARSFRGFASRTDI